MKYILLSFFSFLLVLTSGAQSFDGCESVEFDVVNNRYLISNPGSGEIIARSASGVLSVFKSGISPDPYGIEIMGNTIYACCGGRIKGYDLITAAEVTNINTAATFLNGITHDNSGNLFATDFSGKKIYRINPAASTFNIMASGLVQSPNGIVYDPANKQLVFVNWGSNAPIKAMSLADSVVTVITTTTLGNCDGIAFNGLNKYYISCWTGQKAVSFNSTFTGPPVTEVTGLSNPADIFYNQASDTLAIPNSNNSTLRFAGFEPITNAACNLLPLEIDVNNILFEESDFASIGDSMISIPITNLSGLNFAYPLARITLSDPLPAGFTFGTNQQDYQVFASSWNTGNTEIIKFHFNVTEAIPLNFTVDFQLQVTNLIPSTVDTCTFTENFSVNLNPDDITSVKEIAVNRLLIYPNPSTGIISVDIVEKSELVITDMCGRIVFEKIVLPSDKSIDLQGFSKGLYSIKISAESRAAITGKLVLID